MVWCKGREYTYYSCKKLVVKQTVHSITHQWKVRIIDFIARIRQDFKQIVTIWGKWKDKRVKNRQRYIKEGTMDPHIRKEVSLDSRGKNSFFYKYIIKYFLLWRIPNNLKSIILDILYHKPDIFYKHSNKNINVVYAISTWKCSLYHDTQLNI